MRSHHLSCNAACRAGTINPLPALLLSLDHDGQSTAHPLPPTLAHPPAHRDREHHWVTLTRAASGAGLGNCPHQRQGPPSPARTPTSASLLPLRKTGCVTSLLWQMMAKGAAEKDVINHALSHFPHRTGQTDWKNGMGQVKVHVKCTHGDGEVLLHTLSTNSLKQNKYVERAK